MNIRPLSSLLAKKSTTPFFLTQLRSKSDLATFISHLQLCALHRRLSKAKQIHSHLITTSLHSSPLITTSLITLYSKCNLPFDALSVFLSSPHPPNLFTFNSIISALSSNSLPNYALNLYHQLRFKSFISPDKFTFPCTIKACTDLGVPSQVQKIHGELFKFGLDSDVFTASALIHSYLKFGLMEEGQKLFEELPERDVVLWNAMVNGFAQVGDFACALQYFRLMEIEGVAPSRFTVTGILSVFTATADLFNGRKTHGFVLKVGFDNDVAISNALIDLYGKCHAVEVAVEIFESMAERDILSWNSMISAFEYSADHGETLRFFHRMRRDGVNPDPVTVAAVLPACSQAATLMHGREIHSYMVTSGMSAAASGGGDVFVHNALMDMYAKSGMLDDARRVFDRIPNRDAASWNIMIHGFAAHGRGSDALGLFDAMCASGVAPDEVTFVGLLSACSHSGLVGAGREILQRMQSKYGVAPAMEHYSCAVDLLGRAGRLKEAREVAETAGEAGAWRAYLAACRVHGETEEAAEAAERVVGLEPKGSGGYVLLANAYGWAGRYGEVEEVRGEMRRRRVRKEPGCSWVEVAGSGVHAFVTGDQDHPEAERIYGALHGLIGRMREWGGYMPDVMLHGD